MIIQKQIINNGYASKEKALYTIKKLKKQKEVNNINFKLILYNRAKFHKIKQKI